MNISSLSLEDKCKHVVDHVTSDPRWNVEDELMVQVLSFTLYGYALGCGRVIHLMDSEDISAIPQRLISDLGVGPGYVTGMLEHAHAAFTDEADDSTHSQLVNLGYSHFNSDKINKCIESIFQNAEAIANAN